MARKKNRKKQSQGVMFPPVLAATLTMAAVVAFVYLWLCNRCDAIGTRIKTHERKTQELHRRVLYEEYKWSNMKSPRNIETLLRQHNLQMTWPEERNVVRLRHLPAPGGAGAVEDRTQYAQRTSVVRND